MRMRIEVEGEEDGRVGGREKGGKEKNEDQEKKTRNKRQKIKMTTKQKIIKARQNHVGI